ncbi:hypothetical protein ACTPEM_23930, partial [Clostridioides difficile]
GNREWYIAVNDAVGYGEPATLISGLILIPIMLVIAMVLPGNKGEEVIEREESLDVGEKDLKFVNCDIIFENVDFSYNKNTDEKIL